MTEKSVIFQTTIKVEGFVTVTSKMPIIADDLVISMDVETNFMDVENSPVEEVIDSDVTLKEISNTVEIDA